MMKKLFGIVMLCIASIFNFDGKAQTVVNQDGSLKFRGNVAIFTNCAFFAFDNNQQPIKHEEGFDEAMQELNTALRTVGIEKFGNMGFAIVNRDDQANERVKKLLEENKLEDYLNGYSVQAKNQGADWLYILDCNLVSIGNAAQLFIDSRLLNVENNTGYHDHFVSKPINMTDAPKEVNGLIKTYMKQTEDFLYKIFPEQYAITKADGKDLTLAPYQINGRILPTDVFYIYDFNQRNFNVRGENITLQELELIGEATKAELKNGELHVKANKKISPDPQIVLIRNAPEIDIRQGVLTTTFFGLNSYEPNSMDGFIKTRINNAMYKMLSDNPFVMLIEQDNLESLKKERELQKSEDFLNGHTIEQMKSIGANYIMHIEDYKKDNNTISFTISIVDVASNAIIRQMNVASNWDNLENELFKVLSERFASEPIGVEVNKNEISFYTAPSLPKGTTVLLEGTNVSQNPLTSELVYTRVPLCTAEVTKSMGSKSILKIVSKTDNLPSTNLLVDYANNGLLTIAVDGSSYKSSNGKTDLEKKSSGNKFKNFMNKVGDGINQLNDVIETSTQKAQESKEKVEKMGEATEKLRKGLGF